MATCNQRGCEGCTGVCSRSQYEECFVPVDSGPAVPVPNEPGAAAVADDITANARRDAYGTPDENHRRTATMWSAYLHARGNPRALSPEDVCWLNILQKVSRDIHSPQPDNLVDAHGYLNNIEEIRRTSG